MKFTIETKFNKDIIIQDIVNDTYTQDNLLQRFSRQVILLQDEGIRKALISLGWTPPPAVHEEELPL